MEELLRALFAELQGLPEERLRRAAAAAQPVGQQIARSALIELRFDDGPYDYPALLQRSAPTE